MRDPAQVQEGEMVDISVAHGLIAARVEAAFAPKAGGIRSGRTGAGGRGGGGRGGGGRAGEGSTRGRNKR